MRKPRPKPLDRSGPVVQLAVNNPIITHEQLAAQHFQPIATFVGLSENFEKLERHEGFLRKIAIVSRFAVSMLGQTKSEMIDGLKKVDDAQPADEMLKWLTDGREAAAELLDMIEQAEARFAIAMANVYNEDGSRKH